MVLDQQEVIKRPFFSIVISCYNSRKTIGPLLESIAIQNINDDIEVIISDDCSTEPYDDIIKPFEESFTIKRVSTEYNCCPSNTREAGAQVATGQWLTFSDHDDIFLKDSLAPLKEQMMKLPEKYCYYTGFYELSEKYEILRDHPAKQSGGWTHGKFYNLDNLWKAYNIHYKKDLTSHEDVYINCKIKCIIDNIHSKGENAITYTNDIHTYGWVQRPESESHKKIEGGYCFLEKYFIDYIEATDGVYFESYYNHLIDYNRLKEYLLDSLAILYFYDQSFTFYDPQIDKGKNHIYLRHFIQRIKNELGVNNKIIWHHVTFDRCYAYRQAYEKSYTAIGNIVPYQSFGDWLKYICPDDSEIPISPYYYKK